MWPPTPMPGRWARCTMIAAFHRIQRAVAALDLLVAGEPRLALGRDRVDVVGGGQRGHADLLLAGPLQQPQHQVAGARLGRRSSTTASKELEPLAGLFGVDVGQLAGQPVEDGSCFLTSGHGVVLSIWAGGASHPLAMTAPRHIYRR